MALESKIRKITKIKSTEYFFKTRLRSQWHVFKNASVQKDRFFWNFRPSMTLNGLVINIFEKLASRASFWRIICLVLRSFQIWPKTIWNDRVTSKPAAKSTRYQSRPRYFFWSNFKGFSMIKCHFFTRPKPARVFSNFLKLTNTEKTEILA